MFFSKKQIAMWYFFFAANGKLLSSDNLGIFMDVP